MYLLILADADSLWAYHFWHTLWPTTVHVIIRLHAGYERCQRHTVLSDRVESILLLVQFVTVVITKGAEAADTIDRNYAYLFMHISEINENYEIYAHNMLWSHAIDHTFVIIHQWQTNR